MTSIQSRIRPRSLVVLLAGLLVAGPGILWAEQLTYLRTQESFAGDGGTLSRQSASLNYRDDGVLEVYLDGDAPLDLGAELGIAYEPLDILWFANASATGESGGAAVEVIMVEPIVDYANSGGAIGTGRKSEAPVVDYANAGGTIGKGTKAREIEGLEDPVVDYANSGGAIGTGRKSEAPIADHANVGGAIGTGTKLTGSFGDGLVQVQTFDLDGGRVGILGAEATGEAGTVVTFRTVVFEVVQPDGKVVARTTWDLL